MKIYTKTGDTGMTSLASGQRVSKTCTRLESYGTIDELNSTTGLLITYCKDSIDQAFLTTIQNKLFIIGGYLATEPSPRCPHPACSINSSDLQEMEQQIDSISSLLPPLKSFVLPGGCRAAAISHVCRTICRRAERCMLNLPEEHTAIDPAALAYINRLSDYFFVLARKLNMDENQPETLWAPPQDN